MSRFVNVLFALVLLIALVIAIDPQSRQKAMEKVREWEPALQQMDNRIIVNTPSLSTPEHTPTPLPTATAMAENNGQIPVTGDDSNRQPIIQVNWNALQNALRDLWNNLANVKIDVTPKDNK